MRRWVPLLALALLTAQWLALVHGVVHGPAGTARPAGALHAPHPATEVAGPDDPWHVHATLGDLFAGHDEVACRLVDAIGHDAAPLIALLVLPALPPVAVHLRLAGGEACARWATLFDARAPPTAAS